MENNFFDTGFEQFLRESTDEFSMYPSRKVWFGIYNDLHPAKKWPSLAVTLLLICTVLITGISNNNSINSYRNNNHKLLAYQSASESAEKSFAGTRTLAVANKNNQAVSSKEKLNSSSNNTTATIQYTETVEGVFRKENQDETNQLLSNLASAPENSAAEKENTVSPTDAKQAPAKSATDADAAGFRLKTTDASLAEKKAKKEVSLKVLLEADKKWVEDYAFYNKPSQKRWKSRSSLQFYVTPSIGFRTMEDINKYSSISSRNMLATNNVNRNINEYVSQTSAINLEVGTMMLYNISKKLRVKAGLQFNYSNYISLAEELTHNTKTTVLLNDEFGIKEVPVTTRYKNSFNPDNITKLNNKSLQFSMPLGADFKVAGNKKLKLYTGATIQPTYVTGGNTYALSADKKYYADFPSLLRRFNLNGSVESVLSYTTPNGASVMVGPQFRYQFLSTYNKDYNYYEKRYNLGVKIGFTTGF